MNSIRFTGEMRTEPESDSILILLRDRAGELIGQVDSSISLIPLYSIFFLRIPDRTTI